MIELSNGVKTLDIYAYLDNRSCASLLLTFAASELAIDMNTVAKIPISGYHTTREKDCSEVSVQIKPSRSQTSSLVSIDVLAVPDLNRRQLKPVSWTNFVVSLITLNASRFQLSNKIKCV